MQIPVPVHPGVASTDGIDPSRGSAPPWDAARPWTETAQSSDGGEGREREREVRPKQHNLVIGCVREKEHNLARAMGEMR